MREILFRGKHSDNKWYYGSLIVGDNKKVYISSCGEAFPIEVYPETVGQYTGLTDKNGKRIFEGDIVHAVYQSNYVGCENVDYGIGIVKYCDSYYGSASYQIDIIGEIGSRVFTASLERGVEVIGNVHDNSLEDFYGH